MRRRSVTLGEVLAGEGDEYSSLFFLQEGWACRVMTSAAGKRQVPAIMVPGEPCNLDALAFDHVGSDIRMLTDGVVLALPLSEARRTYLSDHRAAAISRLALVETSIMAQWTSRMAHSSARERMIRFFCELSYRLRLLLRRNAAGKVSFEVPLTQEWLGSVLGMTTVHVNRTVRQLRDEGLLVSGTRRIVVTDVQALRRAVSFDPSYLHLDAPAATTRLEPACQ